MQWNGFSPSNSASIALKRFSDVITSCFGTNIESEYVEYNYQFEETFDITGLRYPTNVYVLCRHIVTFIQNYLPHGKGLRYVSVKGVESVAILGLWLGGTNLYGLTLKLINTFIIAVCAQNFRSSLQLPILVRKWNSLWTFALLPENACVLALDLDKCSALHLRSFLLKVWMNNLNFDVTIFYNFFNFHSITNMKALVLHNSKAFSAV